MPGRFAVLARRKGDQWFVGGINGTSAEKSVTVKLDFLQGEAWRVAELCDGSQPKPFVERVVGVKRGNSLTIPMKRYWGFVLYLTPGR